MVYIMLADGFGEIAAFTPLDLFRRVGIEVKTVGVTGKIVTGARGLPVIADLMPWETDPANADMIYLPGAYPGVENLRDSEYVRKALLDANKNGHYIVAICAAPAVVLGELGILEGRKATCIQGEEAGMKGAILQDQSVVVDGNLITGRNAGAIFQLSVEMCKMLKGEAETARIQAIANCVGK